MKKYKVLNPISFGGRHERGSIITISDHDAKRFDDKDIELYIEEEIVDATDESTPEVEEVKTPEEVVNTPEVTPDTTTETESNDETKTEEVTPEVEA